jgi:hypothetical protein
LFVQYLRDQDDFQPTVFGGRVAACNMLSHVLATAISVIYRPKASRISGLIRPIFGGWRATFRVDCGFVFGDGVFDFVYSVAVSMLCL